MAIERNIVNTPTAALIAGLAWRPPTGGAPSRKALMEARELTEATHYTLAQIGDHAMYGLFQPRPVEEDEKMPKRAYAAAALFARQVGQETPNAALFLQLPGTEGQPGKCYLIVLEDGLPSIDMLGSEADVLRILGDEEHPIWTDQPERFGSAPATETVDLAWLAGLATPADKGSRLQRFPTNPWPPVIVSVLVVVAGASAYVWDVQKKAEAERQAALDAAAADPKPKYLSALAAQRPAMATRREQVVATTASLFDLPAFVPGWQLRSVECDAREQACSARWDRRGGGYDELRAALPKQRLVTDPAAGASLNFDRATTRWPISVARQPVTAKLPLREEAINGAGSLYQRWLTADLALDIRSPSLWPKVPEVPPTFKHPDAVLRGELIVKEIPGPFAVEVIEAAPPWVSWESVRLDVGDPAAGAKAQLKFSLSGIYYVASPL